VLLKVRIPEPVMPQSPLGAASGVSNRTQLPLKSVAVDFSSPLFSTKPPLTKKSGVASAPLFNKENVTPLFITSFPCDEVFSTSRDFIAKAGFAVTVQVHEKMSAP
jgi:hypothetical protein